MLREISRIKKQFKKVATIGFSMGGLVAIHLAHEYGADFLTMVNTPIYCGDGKKILENIRSDMRKRNYESIRNYYKIINETPFKAIYYFTRGLKECIPLIGSIKAPC